MVMINGVPPNGMQHGLHVHEFGITVDTQNITESKNILLKIHFIDK